MATDRNKPNPSDTSGNPPSNTIGGGGGELTQHHISINSTSLPASPTTKHHNNPNKTLLPSALTKTIGDSTFERSSAFQTSPSKPSNPTTLGTFDTIDFTDSDENFSSSKPATKPLS
ncbi:unnamed protein product [Ambrosiozyma monospora]|uniref:Unnamed protein product n=1 Tax=Ambrosiozyma monospora TaxID=43982 RepID=A0ACB5TWV1_AMBMO|nr:unnamed protein product [Ambrosiozyma monospora]